MESAYVICVDYKVDPRKLEEFSRIYKTIISYYLYLDIEYCKYVSIHDPVLNLYYHILIIFNNDRQVEIPKHLMHKIVTLDPSKYLGAQLIASNVLGFMLKSFDIKKLISQPWGLITLFDDVKREDLQEIKKELDKLNSEYHYFVKSDPVMNMIDKLNIYHTTIGDMVIVTKKVTVTKMLDVLSTII